MWKHSTHPNIIPLLGIIPTPLQLISEWISGGYLTEYIKKHPDVDRLALVGVSPVLFQVDPTLIPATSYPTSLKAFSTSTPVISFMVISRGYVFLVQARFTIDMYTAKYPRG